VTANEGTLKRPPRSRGAVQRLRIVVIDGPDRGKIHEPAHDGPVAIGASQDNEVVLGLDAGGGYFLNGNAIAAETLEDHLRSIYATTHTEDKILYFRADKDLTFGKIQDAVEVARKAGVRVMAAITECKTRGSCVTTP